MKRFEVSEAAHGREKDDDQDRRILYLAVGGWQDGL